MQKFFFFLILFVCDLPLATGSNSKKNSVVIVPDLMKIPSNILRFHIKFPEDVAPELVRTGVLISDDAEGGESDFFLKLEYPAFQPALNRAHLRNNFLL